MPIVYEQERGYGLLVSALPFLAVLLGCLTAAAINVVVRDSIASFGFRPQLANLRLKQYSQLVYAKRLDKLGSVEPELRLWPMALGSVRLSEG